jgi:hypothetical protein
MDYETNRYHLGLNRRQSCCHWFNRWQGLLSLQNCPEFQKLYMDSRLSVQPKKTNYLLRILVCTGAILKESLFPPPDPLAFADCKSAVEGEGINGSVEVVAIAVASPHPPPPPALCLQLQPDLPPRQLAPPPQPQPHPPPPLLLRLLDADPWRHALGAG